VLPAFRPDGSLNVVVETPRGSSVKFKYDVDEAVMALSRPLPAVLVYPHDWGFVPATRGPDGDPVDAIIVWDGASYPGIVIPSRAIGLLKVEQTNLTSRKRERNDRLAVLPVKAPRHAHIASVFDLSKRMRDELGQFFLHSVAFEGKALKLIGWTGPDAALRYVRRFEITPTGSPRPSRPSRPV
jgi:inorganic pyrophosphatase